MAGFALKPAPVGMRFPTATANTSATVVTASKYSSALPPTRPTFLKLPMPAIPVTTVQKITSAMIIDMSRMNASPSGRMASAVLGRT